MRPFAPCFALLLVCALPGCNRGTSSFGDSGSSAGTSAGSGTTAGTGTSGSTGGTTNGSSTGGATSGSNPCASTQLLCHGICVDPRVDGANCGHCDNACSTGMACSAGVCASSCQAPLTKCGNACADLGSDNAHCGDCGTACDVDGGQGCVNGSCAEVIAVGPGPQCSAGGPPIFVMDAGAAGCAGNLAQVTFRWALCSCSDVGTSAAIQTDGFDSTQGPYAPGGLGGGFGIDGQLGSSAPVNVGGTLWVSGTQGISSSDVVNAAQELHSGGDFAVRSAQVGGDGYVQGDVRVQQTSALGGTLYLPASASISGPFTAAFTVRGAVSVPAPCDCSNPLPIAQIVQAHASSNDDALIGLARNALDPTTGPTRLDLPCGSYYLSAVSGSNPVTIVSHGNTALYVGGDLTTSQPISIVPDPASVLDVFIAGSIGTSAHLTLGNANYPAQLRIYLGKQNGQAIGLSSAADIAANLYAVQGSVGTSAPWLQYGSLIVGRYGTSASTTIHYDRAVVNAGAVCSGADAGFPVQSADAGGGSCASCQDCGNQACIGGQCGACTSNADCCAPLVCNADGTCSVVFR